MICSVAVDNSAVLLLYVLPVLWIMLFVHNGQAQAVRIRCVLSYSPGVALGAKSMSMIILLCIANGPVA